MLLLNTTSTDAISDPAVRLAIEYAVDREGLNKAVFQGLNKAAWSPLMRPTFAYDASTEQIYTFDPEKAKQLLTEAGWQPGPDGIRAKAGQKLENIFPIISRPRDNAMATSVQASCATSASARSTHWARRRAEAYNQNRYDISFMWFSYGDPDVLRHLSLQLTSTRSIAPNRCRSTRCWRRRLDDRRGQAGRHLQESAARAQRHRGRAAGRHTRLQRQTRRSPGRSSGRAGVICLAVRRADQEVSDRAG